MRIVRYLITLIAIGVIADWGSETFFWSAPPGPVTLAERLATILAYSLCVGTVLSAVIWTGISGIAAAFLGGAMLGFLIEGVVVGTMYDAFPLQVVWTPLAWHALVTGVAVFALGRAGLGAWRMAVAWAAVGAFGGLWAQFWPLERPAMPGYADTLAYLVGLGLIVPAAHLVLDRIAVLPRPPGWVLVTLPSLATLVWAAQTIGAFHPVRFACPVMIGLTVFAMRRLGTVAPVSLGKPAAASWHHALFLIAPIVAAFVAAAGWHQFNGLALNQPVALLCGGGALMWWCILLFRAALSQRRYL